MAERVRIGIVGCGNVMLHYMTLADELARAGEIQVTVACDRDEGKRALVEGKLGIPRFTTEWRAVVDATDVDLVLVLTPIASHAAVVEAALEAGKNVLVEKTLAQTLPDAARLVALAARSQRLLIPAPAVLLSPTYQALAGRVRRGEIGTVQSARARYGWADPFWQGAWVYQRGGGALFEFAVYNITSLTGIFGPARRVTAMTGIAVPERTMQTPRGLERVRVEEEDNGHVLLDFGEGRLALVTTGFNIQRYRSPAIELFGSEGTAQMLGDDWAPQGYEMWQNGAGCWKLFEETHPTWPWTDGLRHAVDCIRRGTRPLMTPEHAYHVLEILLAARASSQEGAARPIESRFQAAA